MRRIALLISALFAVNASAASVETFIEASHTSALFQGKPFNNQDGGPQMDAITAGVTITAGKKQAWEIDLSHGRKRVDGVVWPGSTLNVRFYPGRLR